MKVRYSHFTLTERRKIERWCHAKLSPDEMARRLGRHRSTIFRELRRNHFHGKVRGTAPRPMARRSPSNEPATARQKYGPANVTTLVERTSRFLVVLKNEEKRTKPIRAQIAQALRPLPHQTRRSIALDRGPEFIDWPHLQAEVGTQTWFCEAQSPWRKGAVENASRRLRRWLCRDTDPNTLSRKGLRQLCAGLNATPRKCLGFRIPAGVFKANPLGRGHRRAHLSRKPKPHLMERVQAVLRQAPTSASANARTDM